MLISNLHPGYLIDCGGSIDQLTNQKGDRCTEACAEGCVEGCVEECTER